MRSRSLVLLVGFLLAFAAGWALCKQPDWWPQGVSRAAISLELDIYDRRIGWRPRRAPDPRVVVVAIDVESLDEYGAMPWDRRIHARLVDQLTQNGAGAIALDISFSGRRKGESAEQDDILVQALKASGRAVVARYVDLVQRYDPVTGEAHIQRRVHELPEGMIRAVGGKQGVGLVFIQTDQDHAIRTAWLMASAKDFGQTEAQDGENRLDYIPLAAKALEKMTGSKLEMARLSGWSGSFGNFSLPLWSEAPIILFDFPGRPFPVYSYRDVIDGKVGAAELKDKLVIVGATYDLADSFVVPRNPAGRIGPVPGCFTHAVLADQLLSGHFLRFASYPLEGEHASPWLMGYLYGAALALLSLLAHRRWRLTQALKLNALLLASYALVTILLLTFGGVYVNVVVPFLMVILAQLPILIYELWQVRAVLRWFVPQEDVESLMRAEGRADQSQTQIATILFVDIRDYTTLSEKLVAPSEVRALVSQFHTVTAKEFEKFGGYVCDFQGDAQMVAFGVTPRVEGHAVKAIAAAAALPAAVARLNSEVEARYPQLNTDGRGVFRYGVGICTGEVSVGYLQGGGKLQHTVLGDTTNTAARLQGLARDLGVITVVSHTAAQLAPEWQERLRPLPAAKLKGKAEPHGIFELIPE